MNTDELRELAREYYSRKDIQKCIAQFSKDREVVPRYIDAFGKRPDTINYSNDISALIKKGVTSFHSSEELWQNPMELSTGLNEEKMKKLRKGWDLILDVDCKSLDFSKIAAELLIEALKDTGVKNFGIKYSGNKGFHIGVSSGAFPEKVRDIEIKNYFPDGARIIAAYLGYLIENHLADRILQISSIEELAKLMNKPKEYFYKKICKKCGKEAIKDMRIIKKIVSKDMGKDDNTIEFAYEEVEIIKCPKCNEEYCKNPSNFDIKEEFNPYSVLDIDTILISPRHLFRMPYSLHEKTGLVSIVVFPSQLKDFSPHWAKPHRVIPKQFLPEPEKDEAKKLLLRAFDWNDEHKEKETRNKELKDKLKINQQNQRYVMGNMSKQEIELKDVNPEFYPPCIKKILNGMKDDGRKRALFVLINFFKSIDLSIDEIELKINEWNKLNYNPLKEGYIKSQISWHGKQEAMLPPNCDKQHYKGIGICSPDFFCQKARNPVYYVKDRIRIAGKQKETEEKENRSKRKSDKTKEF